MCHSIYLDLNGQYRGFFLSKTVNVNQERYSLLRYTNTIGYRNRFEDKQHRNSGLQLYSYIQFVALSSIYLRLKYTHSIMLMGCMCSFSAFTFIQYIRKSNNRIKNKNKRKDLDRKEKKKHMERKLIIRTYSVIDIF